MSATKSYLPSPGSLPDLILSLVALCGEMPNTLLNKLPGSDKYKMLALNRLKSKGLLRSYYRNNLRGVRLTADARKTLLLLQSDRYSEILSGNSILSSPKYDVSSRLRLHRLSEVLVLMYLSGASVFPWEKPGAFLPDELFSPVLISQPTYYSSLEVKRIGEQGNIIRNSRATGVLLAPDRIFAVFNTADGEMKWEYEAELRLKILLQQDICYTRLPDQYASVCPGAIVVSPDMNQFPPLLRGKAAGKKPFVQGNQFDHFHYLTTDHHGEVLLQILCSPKQRNQLDRTLLCDLAPARAFLTENDGFDEKGNPVLLAYSCDIPRIYRFYSGLVAHGLRGTAFCFDFQEAALREVCGNTVSFEVIDFDIYERSVFHNTL